MPDPTDEGWKGNESQTDGASNGNPDEVDGVSRKGSPISRRQALKLTGATVVGTVATSAAVSAATTVNLGNEGLSDGDDISPYLDQYWGSDTEVVVPAGSYQLNNNDSIGIKGSNAVLRGDGEVELYSDSEVTNPFIGATAGTVRIENITIRNDPSLGGLDIDVENGATLEFVNFNMPDGQLQKSEMYPTFLNRSDANGTVRWDSCTMVDQGDNCIYTGQSQNCTNIVENCKFVRCNIDMVRVGGDGDVVRNNEFLMDAEPAAESDGAISGRGVRVRYDGSVTIENNVFRYEISSVDDPVVVRGNASVTIKDNEVYTATDWAMRRHPDSNSSISGSGNVLTGPTTEVLDLPYDQLVACPGTEGGDGSTCTTSGSSFAVSTAGTSNVDDTTAMLEGSLKDLGGASSADVGFEYRETGASSWTSTATETLSATGSFSRSVDGLSGATEYECRAVGDASDGDADAGTAETFTTSYDHHLVIRPAVDAGIDYEFTTTGEAAFGPEAESKNDSLTANSDGSYTATGYVTYDYTDDWYYNGEVTGWSATKDPDAASGEYELVLDGTVVTPDELTVDTGPSVSTGSASDVGGDSATLSGSLDDLGGASSAEVGFEYRETGASSWTSTATETLSATGSFSRTVDGISGGTEYEFRAVATASDGDTAAGNPVTFATGYDHRLVIRPAVDAGIDYEFTTSGAMAFGPEAESKNDSVSANSDGSYTATGFVMYDYTDDWKFNGEVTDWSATRDADFASGEYELVLDGTVVTPDELTGDTDPAVTTGSATDVTRTAATLSGSVDDLGGASSADVVFDYHRVGASDYSTTAVQTVSSTSTVSTTVEGLVSGTDYEFRIRATASDGDGVAGSPVGFTTDQSSAPVVDRFQVEEEGSPNPHADITVDWGVTDADGDLSQVVVQVRDGSGTAVDEATTAVSGDAAYGLDYFKIKDVDGQSFDVRLAVTDGAGGTTTATTSVTE